MTEVQAVMHGQCRRSWSSTVRPTTAAAAPAGNMPLAKPAAEFSHAHRHLIQSGIDLDERRSVQLSMLQLCLLAGPGHLAGQGAAHPRVKQHTPAQREAQGEAMLLHSAAVGPHHTIILITYAMLSMQKNGTAALLSSPLQ